MEASEELDRFLARCPDHAAALELRARIALALGKPDDAIPVLDRAIAVHPTPDLYLQRARLQIGRGDRFAGQAVKGLDQGVQRLGPLVSLESYAAELELRRGRADAALARLDKIAPQVEHPKAVLERRGEILLKAGRPMEARLAFAAAVAEGGPWPTEPVRKPTLGARVPLSDPAVATIPSRALAGSPASGSAAAALVTRGPYLQVGTPTSVVVRWRTNVPTDSRVSYGKAPGALFTLRDDPVLTTEHEVPATGLTPSRHYCYSVGTTAGALAGDDADHGFVTPPLPGTRKPTRLWVIGDSGSASTEAAAVRDAYAAYTGSRPTDLWLMLGDNAYQNGTDAEYQAAVFDMYPKMLQKSVLWPTRGNHDNLYSGNNNDYYEIFTLPTAGQAGGLPSGTEAYYSFDYANIHFICLDSEGSDRTPSGAMLTWLAADLAGKKREWMIAFWHHPPYSKGSHDSDDELDSGGRMRDMRQNALPILEAGGVDLVLTGHSHSYERSFLLDGHYGVSTTLTQAMKVDPDDGRTGGDGPYRKPSGPHRGAVYAVAGTAGHTDGGPLDHPVMIASLNVLGSLVLDVSGNTLEGRFLDEQAVVRDSFTIIKGGVVGVPQGGAVARTAGVRSIRPNPFVNQARIAFWLRAPGRVRLSILDAGGRRLRTLLDEERVGGSQEVVWDGRDPAGRQVGSGVYFAVLETKDRVSSRRLIRVR
jgi:hypothetical protein